MDPIEGGVQQVYNDIRESLELILQASGMVDEIERQTILVCLDDAISNNWDELMRSFWAGVHADVELTMPAVDET